MQSFTRWINFRLILVMARLIDGLRDGNGGRDRGGRWERASEGSSETEPDLTRERKKGWDVWRHRERPWYREFLEFNVP